MPNALTARALAAWLEARPMVKHTAIFCSISGHTSGAPLTPAGLHRVLYELKTKAGIVGRLNPHSLRHMFAREQIRNGNDLATVSQLLGHSSVSVTADFYAVFNTHELAVRHSRFSATRHLIDSE